MVVLLSSDFVHCQASEVEDLETGLQDVFATPASPASAQGRSASKSGTASRDPRPHSAGRQAAPASAADDNGNLSAGRKRAALSSAGADAEGASSGARAKRSKLAPISTEAEAGEAEPDQTPIPEPGSPAAHTRSHDHVRSSLHAMIWEKFSHAFKSFLYTAIACITRLSELQLPLGSPRSELTLCTSW